MNPELIKAYRRLFSSEDGQTVLTDLKNRFGWSGDVERCLFTVPSDPAQAAFMEGRKEAVRTILRMMQADPNAEPRREEALHGLEAR